jgi:hypothetical protein
MSKDRPGSEQICSLRSRRIFIFWAAHGQARACLCMPKLRQVMNNRRSRSWLKKIFGKPESLLERLTAIVL